MFGRSSVGNRSNHQNIFDDLGLLQPFFKKHHHDKRYPHPTDRCIDRCCRQSPTDRCCRQLPAAAAAAATVELSRAATESILDAALRIDKNSLLRPSHAHAFSIENLLQFWLIVLIQFVIYSAPVLWLMQITWNPL